MKLYSPVINIQLKRCSIIITSWYIHGRFNLSGYETLINYYVSYVICLLNILQKQYVDTVLGGRRWIWIPPTSSRPLSCQSQTAKLFWMFSSSMAYKPVPLIPPYALIPMKRFTAGHPVVRRGPEPRPS